MPLREYSKSRVTGGRASGPHWPPLAVLTALRCPLPRLAPLVTHPPGRRRASSLAPPPGAWLPVGAPVSHHCTRPSRSLLAPQEAASSQATAPQFPPIPRGLGFDAAPGVERAHPVTGFDCERSEVSGRRLWGLFAELFGTAETFFDDHFIANFCPLVWMKDTGANLTPDNLPRESMVPVEEACSAHLKKIIEILQPTQLIGVGGFAEKQLAAANPGGATLGRILHPSPASPAANRDFAGTATKQLKELGLL